ncbi:MAG: ABC transporter permease [Clostridiales bacterium]|nr:ABC transporter permease [Clostridiales bacterium]
MNILVRHTLRSIKRNSGQSVVIILTIILVTAMLFVALTIGDLFYNLNVALDSRLGSSTDITLTGDVFATSKLNEFIKKYDKDIEYVDTYLQIGALFKNQDAYDKTSKAVLVEATDTLQLAKRYPEMLIVAQEYNYSYQHPAVWVGKSFMEENKLECGQVVEIYLDMYHSYQKMTITYVFENQGFFANSTVNNLIIDYSSVNAKGMLNLANIKLSNDANYRAISKALYEHMDNENLTVSPSVNYEKVARVVKNNQLLLNVSLVFIVALMLFILFTSYLVVTRNRVGEMAIFKSVGATSLQTALIMISEAILYGVIGASVGLIIGRIGMGLAVMYTIPQFISAVTFSFSDYVFSFLLGITISVLGAILPVINVSKESVRSLTASNVKIAKKGSLPALIISTVLLVVCVILLVTLTKYALAVTIALVVAVALWIILIIPYVIKAISWLFTHGAGSHRIAGFSIKRNSYSRTLSAMVGSIITFSFIVISIINIIIYAVTPYNARFESDFVIESIDGSDLSNVRETVSGIKGVKDAFLYYEVPCRWELGTQIVDYRVYTVDNIDAVEGISEKVSKQTLDLFNKELRPVIVSYDLMQRLNLEIGQEISITLGDKDYQKGTLGGKFKIIGIDYAMTSTDRVMIIPESALTIDGEKVSAKSMIFVNASQNVWKKDLYSHIRDKIETQYSYILEFDNWAYATSVGIKGIANLLMALQIIVSLVAMVGVINLTIVTRLSRKQEHHIYSAVGMDKKGYTITAVCEGFIIALTGGIIGFILSFIINRLMPSFAILIDRYVVFKLLPWYIPAMALASILMYTLVYLAIYIAKKTKYVYDRGVIK